MSERPLKNQIYYLSVEEYLQPKAPQKIRKLQVLTRKEPKLREKFLENANSRLAACKTHLSKIPKLITPKFGKFSNLPQWTPPKVPNVFAFLKAKTKDDGLCLQKTGFDIYCEMASINGFIMFVGATTWERVFWCAVILTAVILSVAGLLVSHLNNLETPTILYTESPHHPAWTVPFPAVTICNLNRISRRTAVQLAKKFLPTTHHTLPELLGLFRLPLYLTDDVNATQSDFEQLQLLLDRNNYTLSSFLQEMSPHCESLLIRCKWKGLTTRCDGLFQLIATPQGLCCSFTYNALRDTRNFNPKSRISKNSLNPHHVSGCGYKSGLTVLIDPQSNDYMAGLMKTTGIQVIVHDSNDFPDNGADRQFVQSQTETSVKITPESTYGTDYIRWQDVEKRQCLFEEERELFYFRTYSQMNCLAECRSTMMFRQCGCVPHYLPRNETMPVCRIDQASCVLRNNHILQKLLTADDVKSDRERRNRQQFICNCYPRCTFNHYSTVMDTTTLNRHYSFGDVRFFKDIDVNDHILLHVFYGDLIAQRYRLDVYENWLSFLGTFGGITGLHMGCSFVSCFELIFFTCVRPLCYWMTRKQIRYRIRRRQKKEAAANRQALEEQQSKNQISEEL